MPGSGILETLFMTFAGKKKIRVNMLERVNGLKPGEVMC